MSTDTVPVLKIFRRPSLAHWLESMSLEDRAKLGILEHSGILDLGGSDSFWREGLEVLSDERPVGFMVLEKIWMRRTMVIQLMYVAPGFRRNGIAFRMIDHAFLMARLSSFHRLETQTFSFSEGKHVFDERFNREGKRIEAIPYDGAYHHVLEYGAVL